MSFDFGMDIENNSSTGFKLKCANNENPKNLFHLRYFVIGENYEYQGIQTGRTFTIIKNPCLSISAEERTCLVYRLSKLLLVELTKIKQYFLNIEIPFTFYSV